MAKQKYKEHQLLQFESVTEHLPSFRPPPPYFSLVTTLNNVIVSKPCAFFYHKELNVLQDMKKLVFYI